MGNSYLKVLVTRHYFIRNLIVVGDTNIGARDSPNQTIEEFNTMKAIAKKEGVKPANEAINNTTPAKSKYTPYDNAFSRKDGFWCLVNYEVIEDPQITKERKPSDHFPITFCITNGIKRIESKNPFLNALLQAFCHIGSLRDCLLAQMKEKENADVTPLHKFVNSVWTTGKETHSAEGLLYLVSEMKDSSSRQKLFQQLENHIEEIKDLKEYNVNTCPICDDSKVAYMETSKLTLDEKDLELLCGIVVKDEGI
jgi:hypothetical protein